MDPYSELDFIDLAHRLQGELDRELPHLCASARYEVVLNSPLLVVECPLADIEWTARFALPPQSDPLVEAVQRYIIDGVVSRLWQVSSSLN